MVYQLVDIGVCFDVSIQRMIYFEGECLPQFPTIYSQNDLAQEGVERNENHISITIKINILV